MDDKTTLIPSTESTLEVTTPLPTVETTVEDTTDVANVTDGTTTEVLTTDTLTTQSGQCLIKAVIVPEMWHLFTYSFRMFGFFASNGILKLTKVVISLKNVITL